MFPSQDGQLHSTASGADFTPVVAAAALPVAALADLSLVGRAGAVREEL